MIPREQQEAKDFWSDVVYMVFRAGGKHDNVTREFTMRAQRAGLNGEQTASIFMRGDTALLEASVHKP